ncbi:MAG: aminoacyl-histidine dipeptidase [Clostridia bacterium]|nr:aminoacyl-histidine dipeptidase [Clostridia bacterium]MBQ3327720.1 aminoacyl-histidine dipeptidase [Clostridia bacterium]
MEYKITGFEPAALFRNFEEFSAVPRGSFHNEKVSDFLVTFARDRGLEVYRDEALNVIIKKPGQNGGEGRPPVILQGHMDMVCEKVHGCDHDFETQGIDMYVTDDGWLTANGTTLGGDDGIADATMMTLLDDDTLTYPPLECVFTTDEEVGLLGANVLDYSKLDGRLMLNLDSEDEGVATVSCAGGMDYTMTRALTCEKQSGETVTIDVKGLLGGHSGTDIDLGHANADKLIARAVLSVLEEEAARLVSFTGGTKGNAIPREAAATLWFPTADAADTAAEKLHALGEAFTHEIRRLEPGINVTVSRAAAEVSVMSREDTEAVISAIVLAPNGVQTRDPLMDNFVISSLNLGIVRVEDGTALLGFAPRSSVDSLMDAITNELALTAKTFGFETEVSGAYPGWEKVEDSVLCDTMKESYRTLFGKELKVEGIHAGLECGLFFANLPGLDPVSIGPTMRGVHTPDEKMDLTSCEQFYKLVVDVLERLAK